MIDKEERDKKRDKERYGREIVLLCIMTIGLVVAIICDKSGFIFPGKLSIKIPDKESFMNSMFSVQAAVVTISIAIVALLSGNTRECYYGIAVSKFITQDMPYIFKHKRVIITNLVIILAAYILLAKQLYNVAICLFFISIVLIIIMVIDVFDIFSGDIIIKESIRNYVLSTYSKEYLVFLNNDLSIAIGSNNTLKTKEDMQLVMELFMDLFDQELSNLNIDILKDLEVICGDSLKRIALQKDERSSVFCLEFLCGLYLNANKAAERNKQKPYPLLVWDNCKNTMLSSASLLTFSELTWFIRLHGILYNNMDMFENGKMIPVNNTEMASYTSWIYYRLFITNGNSLLTTNEKKYIKIRLFDIISSSISFGQFRFFEKEKKEMLLLELSNYTKDLIDNFEGEVLEERFFSQLSSFTSRDNFIGEFYLIILIYIYYITLCESDELVKDKKQWLFELVSKKKNQHSIYNFIRRSLLIINEDAIMKMKYNLRRWEIHEEGHAKWSIMENTIRSFYVFYLVFIGDNLYEKLFPIVNNSSYVYYNQFFEGNRDSVTEQKFGEFVKLFFGVILSTKELKEKIIMLKNVLNYIYKEESKNKSESNIQIINELNTIKGTIKQAYKDQVSKIFECFSFRNNDEKNIVVKEVKILRWQVPVEFYEKNKLLDDKFFLNSMKQSGFQLLFWILKDALIIKKVKYDSDQKIGKFLDELNNKQIKADIVIGNRDFFYNDPESNKLKEFMKNKEYVESLNTDNYLAGIDSSMFFVNIESIDVKVDDIPDREIIENCRKTSEGQLLYNITNEIYLPFEETELIDYVHKTTKVIEINVKVSYLIRKDIIGAGIEIDFSD